jgi:MSHA biogenesis protein MshM
MYCDHYALLERPFALTPDTAYAYASRAHVEALNTLLLALDDGAGFIQITGAIGTGKTLACRRLLSALTARAPQIETAYLPNPSLTPRALLAAIARELRLDAAAHLPDTTLLATLNEHLLAAAQAERKVVVCLDEAQAMPVETLEALRLISNLETEKRKLIQIVLFGQPELETKLAQRLPQLASRIAFHYRLAGLTPAETAHYVAHRLHVAGYRGPELFERSALALLHRTTRGVPRLINVVAHKALLLAYGEGAAQVQREHVHAAASDTPATQRDWRARLAAWAWPLRMRASL